MSAGDVLLVFLDSADGFDGWLRLGAGSVVARGRGLEGLPPLADPDSGDPLQVAAVVPGDAVTLHWLELPAGLAPAQALAAARLMAAEVSAQPIADMHVAVGAEVEGTARVIALTPALAMAGWLSRLQAQGIDADLVIPEPMLLRAPEKGFVRYDRGAVPLYRGATDAFSLEPELAALIVGDAPVEEIGDEAFEAGLAGAVIEPVVNLRQGPFAKRRAWKIEWSLVRRLALLALGILIVTLAIQIAAISRYTRSADALEAEAARVAVTALPGSGRVADPAAALERRLADLGGGNGGYGAIAPGLFGAIRATPNVQLTALLFDRDGSVRATVQGDTPAAFAALRQRVEASGLAVEVGAIRSGGGRPTAELTVRTP